MITPLTAGYWNTSGNSAPWGRFGPKAELAFSFDASEWAAASGANLALQSFTVIADPRLTITAQALLANVMTVKIKKVDPTVAADIGQFIPFTLRMILTDGQHDDRTFNLLVVER